MPLNADERARLLAAARQMMTNAYAPYSNFPVGAALLTEEGDIITGCNVENSSYGLTMCAERNAVGAAVALGQRRFRAIAIAASPEQPVSPCGACRQVLSEFNPEMPVLSIGRSGKITEWKVRDLLPDGFAPGDLASQ